MRTAVVEENNMQEEGFAHECLRRFVPPLVPRGRAFELPALLDEISSYASDEKSKPGVQNNSDYLPKCLTGPWLSNRVPRNLLPRRGFLYTKQTPIGGPTNQ